MDWNRNLYLGAGAAPKEKRIRARIEKGKAAPGIYLVTLAANRENLLEIIAASYLMQKPLREHCPKVVGMARGKEEAFALVQEILMEVYRQTGGFAVEAYMQGR